MATINHFGPYNFSLGSGLPPGESRNFHWGPDDRLKEGTINVTGHPSGNKSLKYLVWVSNISVENVITPRGDIPLQETIVHATFKNVGQETIEFITAYITIITD